MSTYINPFETYSSMKSQTLAHISAQADQDGDTQALVYWLILRGHTMSARGMKDRAQWNYDRAQAVLCGDVGVAEEVRRIGKPA